MDEKQIFPILQRLQDPGPLDPNEADPEAAQQYRDLYVADLHDRHGDSTIRKLKLDILSSAGGRHAYLFSGTIGSGKSTELRRLANEMRPDNFALVINAQDYLNPQLELSISELLIAMSLAVWEATAKEIGVDPSTGEQWNWLQSLFRAEVEVKEVEFSGGIAKTKIALLSNPTLRERMRKFHEARLDQLVSKVHEFFATCAGQIREQRRLAAPAKLLLVVDSLEHFGGQATPGQPDQVFASLQRLFNTFSRHLLLPEWSVVYSVPPLLHKLAPGLANAFGMSATYFLTSAHVFLDRSEALDTNTVDQKLLPLVHKRIGEAIAPTLIPMPQMRQIVEMTGGDLRDLIRCVRAVLLKAMSANEFPVTDAHLQQTFNELRRPYLPLSVATLARLAYVQKNYDVLLPTEADWPVVMSDLTQKRVLLYLNGQEWYGVHPMLKSQLPAST
jgi:hypothetical protein